MNQAGNAGKSKRLVSLIGLILAFSLPTVVGCQNSPILGRMKQNQLENERLLSEFRSQQREVEQLRADRNRLLQQQAETEKLAAKLQAQLNGRREAATNGFNRTADRSFSEPTRVAQDRLDRSFTRESEVGSNRSSDSLNWRPIRKTEP